MSAVTLRPSGDKRWDVLADGRKIGYIHKQTEGEPVLSGRIMVGRRAPRGYYGRRLNESSIWFRTRTEAINHISQSR